MDSFFARNRLSAYLDGALSDAEAAEVSEAIERDPDLRAEFEALQHAIDLLRREGPAEAPAGFHARVMEQVRDEPVPGGVVVRLRRVFTRVPVEVLALAAAAAVVFVVIGGKPDLTDDEPLSPAAELDLPVASSNNSALAPDDTRQAAAPAPNEPPPIQTKAPYASKGTDKKQAAAKPAGTKKTGVSTPSEPMQAEWEKQPQAGDLTDGKTRRKADLAVPHGYKMVVRDANTLYAMGKLAERYQGFVKDSAGRTLKSRALTTDDDFAQLMVVVPKSSEGAMQGDLSAMGGQPTVPPPDAPMYGGEYAVFFVEVRYQP